MLRILFNEYPDEMIYPQWYFDNVYEDEWLYDKDVIQIVKDVDNSELIGQCVISPVLGSIPVEKISGGAKALILLLKMDKVLVDLTACGQNCVPWLVSIISRKDIDVCMNGSDLVFDGYNFESICLNDGEHLYTGKELTYKVALYYLEKDAKVMKEYYKHKWD